MAEDENSNNEEPQKPEDSQEPRDPQAEEPSDPEEAEETDGGSVDEGSGEPTEAASAGKNVQEVYIEDEMRNAYLDYSMSVIISRALPDVRDGLKPSQRRILLAMNDLSLSPGRQYRKCAKIAGDTSGNYHPHGEQVVYPTLVRMAQEFSMRYPLIDGQGNFGSVDGDPPAAMRYTEARMEAAAMEMMADIDKETVDFVSNYDETRQEPVVLPSKFPNLICNGSSGIAVGMSTNIPPHNLGEVVDAMVKIINEPETEIKELSTIIKGPDFPTGALISGRRGIMDAYNTGRGLLTVRARTTIEDMRGDRERIVVTEIPFMVNKNALIEKIAGLVKDKRVEGISDIRDESDRDGMRVVIELKKGNNGDVILNQLYKYTQLQDTFGIILLALVDGKPQILNLKQLLEQFINYRHDVIVRRTKYELARAEHRAHILEGLKIALDNIDAVIETIKASADPDTARVALMVKFKLSEIQANAILQMRLQRLTGLERDKIEEEYQQLIKLIEKLKGILASRDLRLNIIKEELTELKEKYGDDRRTDIIESSEEFTIEDLIAEEDMIITISHFGYVKRLPMTVYRKQRRGGKGIKGISMKDDDFVEHLFIASTHDYILFFTNQGRCYWLKVHEIPVGGRLARGKPIVNLIEIQKGESISAFIPVRNFDDEHYLVMATKKGIIKKTVLSAYGNPRRGGINAITLDGDDNLIDVKRTDGQKEIVLGTASGKAIRFNEDQVRPMGRTSRGVKGITLEGDDAVVGLVVVRHQGTLLVATQNGYGKRTAIDDYRAQSRGGKGIITMITNERNGHMMAILEVIEEDELMIITRKGIVIRTAIGNISVIGRNTQGVRLINLDEEDQVIDIAKIMSKEENVEANGKEEEALDIEMDEAAADEDEESEEGLLEEELAAGEERDEAEGAGAEEPEEDKPETPPE